MDAYDYSDNYYKNQTKQEPVEDIMAEMLSKHRNYIGKIKRRESESEFKNRLVIIIFGLVLCAIAFML